MFDLDDFATDDNSFDYQSGPYIPEASDCMRCGLCLSLCPTYKLVQIEEESPRSRIRTIDKIINDKGNLTAEELGHLNNCTQCRACETICPSQMAYGQLFDQAREKLLSSQTTKPGTHFLAPLGFKLIEHKKLFSMLTVLLAGYQKSGFATLVRKTRLLSFLKLDKAEAILPEVTLQTLTDRYCPTSQEFKGTVALFTGCISEHFDQKTLLASIKVLNAIGFTVLIPKTQGCCGALHQHQGQSQIADQLAINNINVFNTLAIDAIIYTASACGLMLKEYELKDSLAVDKFNVPLLDITEFLCMHWPEGLQLNNTALSGKSVAVHEPCSQRNVSKVSENKHQYVYSLLEKIQGFKVLPLPDNQTCCGAGGIHCLTHPEIAEPLRTIKLDHFQESRADYLVTTNIGCSLHLNTGAALDKVLHPVVLLAELIS